MINSSESDEEGASESDPLINLVNQVKAVIPFRLATTSFIYRDRLAPNVRKLGGMFDEIELLLFESRPFRPVESLSSYGAQISGAKEIDVLPDRDEIMELARLSEELGVTYNIHLPVDISVADRSESVRTEAVDTVKRVVELCSPLNPATHTLHIDPDGELNGFICSQNGSFPQSRGFDNSCLNSDSVSPSAYSGLNDSVKRWQERAALSMRELASFMEPSAISVETLHYPFYYIADIVDAAGMDVCVDAGHLILHDYQVSTVFDRFRGRIPLVHLHGVDFSTSPPADHKDVGRTPHEKFDPVHEILEEFRGVVSLEVFKYEHLCSSLTFLNNVFKKVEPV